MSNQTSRCQLPHIGCGVQALSAAYFGHRGLLSCLKSGRSVKVITQPQVVPQSELRGALPPRLCTQQHAVLRHEVDLMKIRTWQAQTFGHDPLQAVSSMKCSRCHHEWWITEGCGPKYTGPISSAFQKPEELLLGRVSPVMGTGVRSKVEFKPWLKTTTLWAQDYSVREVAGPEDRHKNFAVCKTVIAGTWLGC